MTTYNSDDIDRLEPAYLKNYGLQEAPFSTLHNDKFMYLDAERAQRINMLQHMCRYSNLLLIVQGVHGVGKTALMQRFIQTAEPDWQMCEITANTMIDAEQLLFQAAQGFGVRQLPQDGSELQEMLYARVATFHHNDQIPILIIDDAHELPKDALLAIFNLADAYVDDVNLLRIILFCEPQIEKIINSKDVKALRERVTHTMEIPALDEASTAEYLKHRMAVVGFNGGSPFTPKLVKKIYRASRGVPAQINMLAHQALEEGDIRIDIEQEPQHEMNMAAQEQKQGKPAVYITAAVLLVVLVLVFQDQINNIFNDDVENEVTQIEDDAITQGLTAETSKAELVGSQTESQEQVTTELDLQERIISLSEPVGSAEPTMPSEPEKEEVNPAISPTESSPEKDLAEVSIPEKTESEQTETAPSTSVEIAVSQPKLESVNPNPVPTSRNKQTISIRGEGFTSDSGVMISWTGKEKKLAKHQMRFISENQIDITVTVGLTEDDWTVRVIDPKAGRSNSAAFKVASVDQGYQKDKWILSQNPAGFTLQLLGTNKKENADQFIQQHKIAERAGYFFSQRDGKDWYSVVYGAYPDKVSAQQAAKRLPASLKKIKPWVRRFDNLQASINATRKVVQHKRSKSKKSKPEATAARSDTAPIPLASSRASPAQHEAWLWSQDPGSFTLQLLGARQSNSIEMFLRKYSNLNGKTVYFHTRHDTRDWYTVIYGVYPDRKQAQQAIKRLPQALQTASPWIRSFGSIHAELDRTD